MVNNKKLSFYKILIVVQFILVIILAIILHGLQDKARDLRDLKKQASKEEQQIVNKNPPRQLSRDIDQIKKLKDVDISISENDHIYGNENSPLEIIVYYDFNCPYCRQYHINSISKLMENYEKQIKLTIKHFPLVNQHPQSIFAANAAECASEQKKYFTYIDRLLSGQDVLTNDFFKETAEKLDLDLDKFNNCLASEKYRKKVMLDLNIAQDNNLQAIPSTVINEKMVSGVLSYAKLNDWIKKELNDI
jgi:protein-disulfide isomerase